ncbi:HNH endonuclease [Nostoc sp. C057]
MTALIDLVLFNSIDHIKRKADGGLGTLENAQLTHPYCNTTYKN